MSLLGSDFNTEMPDNEDQVKRGAEWIRDLKKRIKDFANVLFFLDTGRFRPSVIPSSALLDMPGLTPGSYGRVSVNKQGLVTAGFESGETVGSQLKMVTFVAAASWVVPQNVSRVKARIYGAGGGGQINAGTPANGVGGGGGQYVETVVAVSPGSTLSIGVGVGGVASATSTAAASGGSSSVGSVSAKGGQWGGPGGSISPGVTNALVVSGHYGGQTGSTNNFGPAGYGGGYDLPAPGAGGRGGSSATAQPGRDGIVVLEYVG